VSEPCDLVSITFYVESFAIENGFKKKKTSSCGVVTEGVYSIQGCPCAFLTEHHAIKAYWGVEV
jgi:hypothetical protein